MKKPTGQERMDRFIKTGKQILSNQSVTIWIVVVFLLVLARIISAAFLDLSHILNIIRQASGLGIVTIGQTLVILTGGIDLSNGPVITLVDVTSATILNGKDDLLIPVIFLCLSIGLVVGLVNGLLITKLKVPPLVGTLGMFGIIKGIAYVITKGAPKGKIPPSLTFVGSGFVGPIPTQVIFWIGLTILFLFIVYRTPYGRLIYAVGGNPKAARLSGVNVDLIIISTYIISSGLAATAGLILAGYIGTGSLTLGEGYNLNSVAATVVGGTSFSGGVGSLMGSVGGSLFLSIVISLLRFLGLPYSNQLMVQGAILAIAIFVHSRTQQQLS
jgi:ribose/xylose/arabinose/galactoside ABC-type transport system permease subunit